MDTFYMLLDTSVILKVRKLCYNVEESKKKGKIKCAENEILHSWNS